MMRVLHLNTHTSGGSYECAALLCEALLAEGIESQLYCKTTSRALGFKCFLDRLVRRSYISLSTEPWHGTRRLSPAPAPSDLRGIDVVHLHTVADWFNIPSWLESLPAHIAVVISLHDMWHLTGGCFLYRGCDRFSNSCTPCPILKAPFNRILARDEQKHKLQTYRDRKIEFVANSHWLARLAERSSIIRSSGRVRVIAPGVNTAIFRLQDKTDCRTKLVIPQDAFVIAAGAASLTDTNKNIPWLLKQLAGLSGFEHLRVLVAGEGAVEIPASLNVQLMGGLADPSTRAMFLSVRR